MGHRPSGGATCAMKMTASGRRGSKTLREIFAFEYLIFIDHDVCCIPILSRITAMSEKGVFSAGETLLPGRGPDKRHVHPGIFSPLFFRLTEERKNAIRNLLLGRILSRSKTFQRVLRDAISHAQEDFLRVDGYDEVFDQLWGREDSDICYRLFHNNVRSRICGSPAFSTIFITRSRRPWKKTGWTKSSNESCRKREGRQSGIFFTQLRGNDRLRLPRFLIKHRHSQISLTTEAQRSRRKIIL